MKTLKYILIILLFGVGNARAQSVKSVNWEWQGNRVVINFGIAGGCDYAYDVSVSYVLKKEGLTYPLKRPTPSNLSGDVKNISCGSGKTIYWDINQETGVILNEFDTQMQVIVEVYPHARASGAAPIATKNEEDPYYFAALSFVPMANEPYGFTIGSLPKKGFGWYLDLRANKNWFDVEKGSSYDQNTDFRKQRVDIFMGTDFRLWESNLWFKMGFGWRYFAAAYYNYNSKNYTYEWQVQDSSREWATALDFGLNLKAGAWFMQSGVNFPLKPSGKYDQRTLMNIGIGFAF